MPRLAGGAVVECTTAHGFHFELVGWEGIIFIDDVRFIGPERYTFKISVDIVRTTKN